MTLFKYTFIFPEVEWRFKSCWNYLFSRTSKSNKRNDFLYFLQFESSSSLLSIGSLIGGIPSKQLAFIRPQEILTTLKNKEFVKNILIAPDIVQRTFVTQVCEQHSYIFRDISSANHIKLGLYVFSIFRYSKWVRQ